MARLFIAVRPPPDVLASLARLPRPEAPGVRWVPPAQWHVTLRFLGEAALDETVAAIDAMVVAAVADDERQGIARLGPRVSRLGRNVVCVPCEGLEALAATVGEATSSIGDPPDPRPFTGHLTLARLKQRAACGLAGTAFDAAFAVTEIEVVRSTLSSAGAVHEVVHTRSLAL
jgi:2'-5' RNA ligase